ncbi:hypothetical protein ACJX0J_023724 [Zea mays]
MHKFLNLVKLCELAVGDIQKRLEYDQMVLIFFLCRAAGTVFDLGDRFNMICAVAVYSKGYIYGYSPGLLANLPQVFLVKMIWLFHIPIVEDRSKCIGTIKLSFIIILY